MVSVAFYRISVQTMHKGAVRICKWLYNKTMNAKDYRIILSITISTCIHAFNSRTVYV